MRRLLSVPGRLSENVVTLSQRGVLTVSIYFPGAFAMIFARDPSERIVFLPVPTSTVLQNDGAPVAISVSGRESTVIDISWQGLRVNPEFV